MTLIRTRRGQGTAEYAILFAIVIGAAIAMQQYVKSRLQGAVHVQADAYQAASGGDTFDDPGRKSDSTSQSSMNMTDVKSGEISSNSESTSLLTK